MNQRAAGDDLEAARHWSPPPGFALDYFEVRHAKTLAPITSAKDGPLRILVAARLGTTRLIHNIAV
jgi:pantoate--beta-alanine ligase